MEIIEPKRLTNLAPFQIHVKEYTDAAASPGFTKSVLDKQYGFTTIADLKRQLWVNHKGNPEWSPNRLWIAQEQEDGYYKPLDMTWSDQTTLSEGLPSPFDFDGTPDSRKVDHTGNPKAVYPLLNEGVLLESVFGNTTKKVTICVWTLESLIRKIGTALEKPGVLAGYIQLYFPKIKTKEEALKSKDESFSVARDYIAQRNERIKEIDTVLGDAKLASSDPFRLRFLYRWKGILPKFPGEQKSLDILFYEIKISEHIPFLRYFPEKGHGEPLLKLATGPSGFPIISDKLMLSSFLEEEPPTGCGAVLIAKIPFSSLSSAVPAVRNVSLTICWLEDCSSIITLEAPRKDMPLEFGVVEEAKDLLSKALLSVGYTNPIDIKLNELSAQYRIEISNEKPSLKELLSRVSFFSPFLEASTYQDKANTKVMLKWKAVNNYEQEGAVLSYITKRVLKEDADETLDRQEQIHIYIRGIMEEFGRSEEEAKRLFDEWFRRRTEVVPTGADPALAHNTGVEIEILNSHPLYFVTFVGIDSEKTFNRVISIMTAYFYYKDKPQAAAVPEPPKPAVVNAAPLPVKEAAKAQADMSQWMGLLGANDEDEEEEEEEAAPEVHAASPPKQKFVSADAKTQTLEPLKEWYKAQLDMFDDKLFGYSQTDSTVTVFSRTCQASSARQPNVLVAEQLDALIKEYGSYVEWVFLPPPDNIILDIKELSNKDLIKEMLARGFNDIVDERGKALKKKAELLDIFEKSLCAEPGLQGQFCRILSKKEKAKPHDKPIWFVARAGSNPEKPNYYICSEYWCVRDNKPLIPSEFLGNKTIHGLKKDPNSCPFCSGIILEDLKHPKKGETVIKRKGKPGKGEIHEVVGYLDNIHPNKFALPCCFTGPTVTQIKPSEGTEPLPKDTRKGGIQVAEKAEEVKEDDHEEKDKDENKELTKVLKTLKMAYILGYEKRQLEPGRIGLCPPALDEILGQIGSQSVIKAQGVAQHFKPTAKVFVRFGLGNKGASPGLSFLELLGFYLGNLQRAGKPAFKGAKIDIPTIYTAEATLKLLFPTEAKGDELKFLVNFRRAFERANYGNLVHEFAGTSDKLTTAELQKFAKEQEFDLTKNPSIRPHVVRFANSWHNFTKYVSDTYSAKQLKHVENLFATPGVIFPDGLIMIIFEGVRNDEGVFSVKIRCPDYGVSEYSKAVAKPPLAFIWYDKSSDVYEPIIYVEGLQRKEQKDKQQFMVLSTYHESDSKFVKIDKAVQDSLSDFIKQFLSFGEGCGRYENPPHPWMPDLNSSNVPRLSQILKLKTSPEAVPEYILRDRSNRLTGILYKTTHSDTHVYIPALEDGSLGLDLKSLYDVQSLPLAPLDAILNLLTGKSPLAKIPGLKPQELLLLEKDMKFCALRVASNAIIPFLPIKLEAVEAMKNPSPVFADLLSKGKGARPIKILPWQEDIRFLRSGYESTDSALDVVPDAIVEEAYNYLRISLSAWLNTKVGQPTLKQLKALREAHIPLYEKRRRADILLESLIHNWLDTAGHEQAMPQMSLLRRDCLVQKADTCESTQMCSLIGSTCKIKTGTSEKIPDIKVYFTSRIIDEIMRYSNKALEILNNSVPKIRIPLGTLRDSDSILSSKQKVQNLITDLELDYVPRDDFSAGLSYPEDVHDDVMGFPERTDYVDIPSDWKKSGFARIPVNPVIDRLKTSLSEYTGEKYPAIEKHIKAIRKKKSLKVDDPINWSDLDWWCFSSHYKTDVIIARFSFDTDTTKIHKWIKSEKTENYCIVFYIDSPEILLNAKKPLEIKDLPKMVKQHFDSAAPTTWDLLK